MVPRSPHAQTRYLHGAERERAHSTFWGTAGSYHPHMWHNWENRAGGFNLSNDNDAHDTAPPNSYFPFDLPNSIIYWALCKSLGIHWWNRESFTSSTLTPLAPYIEIFLQLYLTLEINMQRSGLKNLKSMCSQAQIGRGSLIQRNMDHFMKVPLCRGWTYVLLRKFYSQF